MKQGKFLCLVLVLVLLTALLAGCACEHEWKDANCKDPKTCSLCDETEGEKTNDHKWEDATTEAPKTCSVCGLTEGEKINVDERFKTSACKDLFGTWVATHESDLAEMGMEGLEGTFSMTMTITFSNDGKMTGSAECDTDAFVATMEEFMYSQFTAQGLTKEQADAAMKQLYGVGVKEYVESLVESMIESQIESFNEEANAVYYVEDGKVYSAKDWDKDFEGKEFTMENGKLVMTDDEMTLEFTKK